MLPPRRTILLLWLALGTAASHASEPNTSPKKTVPAWSQGAVWYQIFPERFRNGDPSNDPTRDSLERPIIPSSQWAISDWAADWYARDIWETALGPDFYANGVFQRRYGGDLQGVLDKLPYLKDLGVTAIYLNPIFFGRSLHKYDAVSMHHVDPYFGPDPKGDLALIEKESADPATWSWTAADKLFLRLLLKAKQLGLRVILDGVFNHTGRDFFAFQDVRKHGAASPYARWYQITSQDDPATQADEFDYHGWWGHKSLPVFAASDDGLSLAEGPKAYVWAITKRWMDPNGDGDPSDGVDGWRLDVADERPAAFWAEWNAYVRSINSEAYTVAETWKESAAFIAEGSFSAAMNYHAFTLPVKAHFADGKLSAPDFVAMFKERSATFRNDVLLAMQNLAGSHDTPRIASMIVNGAIADYDPSEFIRVTDRASPRDNPAWSVRAPQRAERQLQKLVALFQATAPGSPLIYYGDEAGMWGGQDPDCRMPMFWPDIPHRPHQLDPRGQKRDPDPAGFDADLHGYYRSVLALRAAHPALRTGTTTFLESTVVLFERKLASERLVVAIHRGDEPAEISFPVPAKSKTKTVFTTVGGDAMPAATVTSARATLGLPPRSGAVLLVK